MQGACALLSYVAQLALQYWFPHYLINVTIFEENVIEGNMCVLIFPTTLSET